MVEVDQAESFKPFCLRSSTVLLYQSKDLSNLSQKDYISDLANAVLGSYQLSGDRISLKLDVETISVSIDTATPCGLIINELMSNSLKQAFPDDRRGEVSLVLHQSENGEIDMRFSDNGIGLPKGFDFRNTKSLGLTLVRNLSVKQLKGTIEVRTDHPTEFHIKFKEHYIQKGYKAIKKKILIVEDEIIEAMFLAKILEQWGYEVCETVTSGEDAIKETEIENPDLVLMDIYIHENMSGIETASKIRSQLGILIIFMTGYSDEETRQKACAAQPAGYFAEPLNYAKLKETLISMIDQNK